MQRSVLAFDRHHFVSQSKGITSALIMKTLLRIAAALSFLFFFLSGFCLLSRTLFSPASDAFVLAAVGFFFVGTGFFIGPILLVAAEKFRRNDESK